MSLATSRGEPPPMPMMRSGAKVRACASVCWNIATVGSVRMVSSMCCVGEGVEELLGVAAV